MATTECRLCAAPLTLPPNSGEPVILWVENRKVRAIRVNGREIHRCRTQSARDTLSAPKRPRARSSRA